MSDELTKFQDAGINRNRQKSTYEDQHADSEHRKEKPEDGKVMSR